MKPATQQTTLFLTGKSFEAPAEAQSTSPQYLQLYKIVMPYMEAYQTDLTKHDKATIEANPGTPFIYGYRKTGTGLTLLLPDLKTYEDQGVKIGNKYIFSTIETEEMKIEILYSLGLCVYYPGICCDHFYYFDGHKLHPSTREKCEAIHRAHIDKILRDARRQQERQTN